MNMRCYVCVIFLAFIIFTSSHFVLNVQASSAAHLLFGRYGRPGKPTKVHEPRKQTELPQLYQPPSVSYEFSTENEDGERTSAEATFDTDALTERQQTELPSHGAATFDSVGETTTGPGSNINSKHETSQAIHLRGSTSLPAYANYYSGADKLRNKAIKFQALLAELEKCRQQQQELIAEQQKASAEYLSASTMSSGPAEDSNKTIPSPKPTIRTGSVSTISWFSQRPHHVMPGTAQTGHHVAPTDVTLQPTSLDVVDGETAAFLSETDTTGTPEGDVAQDEVDDETTNGPRVGRTTATGQTSAQDETTSRPRSTIAQPMKTKTGALFSDAEITVAPTQMEEIGLEPGANGPKAQSGVNEPSEVGETALEIETSQGLMAAKTGVDTDESEIFLAPELLLHVVEEESSTAPTTRAGILGTATVEIDGKAPIGSDEETKAAVANMEPHGRETTAEPVSKLPKPPITKTGAVFDETDVTVAPTQLEMTQFDSDESISKSKPTPTSQHKNIQQSENNNKAMTPVDHDHGVVELDSEWLSYDDITTQEKQQHAMTGPSYETKQDNGQVSIPLTPVTEPADGQTANSQTATPSIASNGTETSPSESEPSDHLVKPTTSTLAHQFDTSDDSRETTADVPNCAPIKNWHLSDTTTPFIITKVYNPAREPMMLEVTCADIGVTELLITDHGTIGRLFGETQNFTCLANGTWDKGQYVDCIKACPLQHLMSAFARISTEGHPPRIKSREKLTSVRSGSTTHMGKKRARQYGLVGTHLDIDCNEGYKLTRVQAEVQDGATNEMRPYCNKSGTWTNTNVFCRGASKAATQTHSEEHPGSVAASEFEVLREPENGVATHTALEIAPNGTIEEHRQLDADAKLTQLSSAKLTNLVAGSELSPEENLIATNPMLMQASAIHHDAEVDLVPLTGLLWNSPVTAAMIQESYIAATTIMPANYTIPRGAGTPRFDPLTKMFACPSRRCSVGRVWNQLSQGECVDTCTQSVCASATLAGCFCAPGLVLQDAKDVTSPCIRSAQCCWGPCSKYKDNAASSENSCCTPTFVFLDQTHALMQPEQFECAEFGDFKREQRLITDDIDAKWCVDSETGAYIPPTLFIAGNRKYNRLYDCDKLVDYCLPPPCWTYIKRLNGKPTNIKCTKDGYFQRVQVSHSGKLYFCVDPLNGQIIIKSVVHVGCGQPDCGREIEIPQDLKKFL